MSECEHYWVGDACGKCGVRLVKTTNAELVRGAMVEASKNHDEAMRMQALAIGARALGQRSFSEDEETWRLAVQKIATWAYEHATGRKW